MTTTDVDILVIGAGLSGLETAHLLQQAGYQTHVLEATSRVGGKTKTVNSKHHGPGVNDVGAAWINDTTQSEMYKLFQRYNIKGEVQLVLGKSVYEIGEGEFVGLRYGEVPYDEESRKELESLIAHLNKLVDEADLENPASGPNAKELDSCTFQTYCADRCTNEVALAFPSSFTRALLGVEADEVSALYMINYFKSGTGIANLASDGKDGGQYLRARQGMQSISEGLASELKPGTLHLNTAVQSITQDSHNTCTVTAIDGQVFKCRKVVVSVPSTILHHIAFTPPLPPTRQALSDSTVLGYYSKTIYVFDKPWWRDASLTGAFSCYSGPASFSRDTSIPADDQWSISCFVVGELGRQWSKLSKKARQEKMWEQFSNAFNGFVEEIPKPINVLEQEWIKEAWFEGAPCPVMGPGVMTSCGATLKEPFQNVHFVGTETADVWKGYMEGAVRSGQRGAKEVIQNLEASVTGVANL